MFWSNIEKILGLFEKAGVKIVEADGTGDFDEVTDELVALVVNNIENVEVVDEKLLRGIEQSYGE